jgi:succinate dehydrogenase / fumarate reductase cytochrome b subunit
LSFIFLDTKIALYSGDQPHNLFEEMKEEFSKWWVVVIYLIGVISLFWHLLHGFQSAFQTFGINHKKYTPIIKNIGIVYCVVVCLLFALMPIAFYLKWLE